MARTPNDNCLIFAFGFENCFIYTQFKTFLTLRNLFEPLFMDQIENFQCFCSRAPLQRAPVPCDIESGIEHIHMGVAKSAILCALLCVVSMRSRL